MERVPGALPALLIALVGYEIACVYNYITIIIIIFLTPVRYLAMWNSFITLEETLASLSSYMPCLTGAGHCILSAYATPPRSFPRRGASLRIGTVGASLNESS